MARTKSAKTEVKLPDAIALLKADHRAVDRMFRQFEKARYTARRRDIASNICNALRVHTTIEEEIFYPAFIAATKDKPLHHEAVIEHDSAKKLIADIEQSKASDAYFDARVKVLSEMIKHHVKEEEQPGGMFAEAKKSKMDLAALGRKLVQRKWQLSGQDQIAGILHATQVF